MKSTVLLTQLFVVLSGVVVVLSQTDSSSEEIKDADVEGQTSYQTESFLDMVRAMFINNADLATYHRVLVSRDDYEECVNSIVNVKVLQEDVNAVNLGNQDLNVVVKKYCKKVPQLQQCSNNFTSEIAPDLTEDELERIHTFNNITDTLAKFVCFNEGERISRFISDGGPKCISEHKGDLTDCFNQMLAQFQLNAAQTVGNLQSLSLEVKECNDVHAFQTCVVNKVRNCEKSTAANIVEAMCNTVNSVTRCGKVMPQVASDQSNGTSSSSTIGGDVAAKPLD